LSSVIHCLSCKQVGVLPLKAGSVTLRNAVALAPMSGVTDIVFRRIAARLGAGWVVSEMVAAAGLATRDSESRLRAEGGGLPLHIVQLAGRDPHWIAEAAKVAEESGAAVVDLNMGCPAKKVVGGYSGAALLKDLDLAVRLVDAAAEAVAVPVTVKMRLGWDSSAIVAPDLARRAEAAGAQLLTVHGRTRAQFYEGRADWPAIRMVVDAVSIPVVANGDVTDCAGAENILTQSGAAGVMIGRGAQGKAWLPGQVASFLETGIEPAAPSRDVQLALALEHYDGLLSLMGRDVGIRHARKHLGWYLDAAGESGAEVAPALRGRVLACTDPSEVRALMADAFASTAWKEAA
jgi:tRNA-dihydrouridine synthase B